MERKELKKLARSRLKKCYWMMVALCLILSITGIDYVSSMSSISTDTSQSVEVTTKNNSGIKLYTTDDSEDALKGFSLTANDSVVTDILTNGGDNNKQIVNDYLAEKKTETGKIGIVALGHSRGVLAQLVNGVSSGQAIETVFNAIKSISRSKNIAVVCFIILSMLFLFAMKVFVLNILKISIRRVTMELRLYDKVPAGRFLYILFVNRIWNVAMTMLLTNVYTLLWYLTVIGGIIKSYSYQMVPYIIAENPSILPKQAITLSRNMMNGHKFEAFKLNLSFVGWSILDFFTYGITGFLFSNPYKELTKAEYYAYIRKLAKENQIPDAELLNDEYLYEKADTAYLQEIYNDVQDHLKEADCEIKKHTGLRGFFENVFGITFSYDEDEATYQDKKSKQLGVRYYKEVMDQKMYPFRLFALRNKEHLTRLSQVTYDRHYTFFSLIFMFFTMSFIGWCWEVSLHLVSEGIYRNRGFFHGPWLPIYGFGGILILIILYKFREKPIMEFIAGIVLCGCVEYFTAWYMETTHGGMKWWDYTGYFLNIHGRVCAEGLLIFGLGGIAIVYLLAPFLDNHFRKIPKKAAVLATVFLLVVFNGDVIYSTIHPNTGEGITSATDTDSLLTEEEGN